MSPTENQAALTGDLSVLPNAFERLNYLVTLAAKAESLPPDGRRDDDLVEGCQAELWLASIPADGVLEFRFHSDAPAVAALAHLHCAIFSGCTAADILHFEPTALDELGLNRALTPNRQNGARQIVAKIKDHARRAATPDPTSQGS